MLTSARKQRGVALVVAMLFLLIVTILSVTAARNSSMSLRMSSNMQDQNNSLQSVEAALFATLALAGTADDPFDRNDDDDPFQGIAPLSQLDDPNSVNSIEVTLLRVDGSCPRPRPGRGGSSAGFFACDYYRVDGSHEVPGRARTIASLGVVKTVLK
ncbi:MAG: pilus assembly PilX N-terminal domain-containing protein [Gammaproteobacteria bacterium]|jgi:hypothetical protein|nr:pilus assembly PilX N-terminal domain-containing protein [Gammaproteobacteria bacterium]